MWLIFLSVAYSLLFLKAKYSLQVLQAYVEERNSIMWAKPFVLVILSMFIQDNC